MSQIAIDFTPAPVESRERTIEDRFREFHAAHPQVYAELVRLAREAKARGRRRIGIKMLWEVVRWNLYLTPQGEEFKLNNSYTSRYARLIQRNEPALADLFETRVLKS